MWEIIAYKDKDIHKDLVRLGWTYLHGKLEDDAKKYADTIYGFIYVDREEYNKLANKNL